jgi:tetratricopeptide (TPR) repeat protein
MRAPPESFRTPLVLLCGLLVLTAAVYWPGLGGPLLLDDHENLEPLFGMQAGAVTWQEVLAGRASAIGGRPVAMLTFVANWLIDSGDVWSLKLTNLKIHLLCGVLLFFLSARLLAEPLAGLAPQRWWLALLITALWLLAPMLVSTVLYVIQRMAQLATLFVLAGLLSYVAGRQHLERRRGFGIGLMLLGFVVFWPLATLSKQNGALLPLLALIVELGFFRRPESASDRRLVHGLLAASIALPALAALIILGIDPSSLRGSYQAYDFSVYERLLTESRILFDYACNLLMIPGGSALGLFHDDFTVSRGLLDPPTTIIAIAAWIALLVAAWRLGGGRWATILFGPVFFLAAHLLESTLIPLELYFEHRNYLPSVGLFVSLGVVAGRLVQRTHLKKTFIAVVAVVPLANGVLSVARVVNWQSNETLLLASARAHPDSPRVHTGLAGLYIGRGELDKAFGHLDRADALYRGRQSYAIALHRLAAYCTSGRSVDERHYAALAAQDRIADSVYTANALRQLVDKAQRGECGELDLERIADVVGEHVRVTSGPGDNGRNWALRLYTAKLLAILGRKREAVEHALAAAALQPTWLEPGLLAIEYQLELGDQEGARRTLAELRRRDDGRVKLYTQLIDTYRRRLE